MLITSFIKDVKMKWSQLCKYNKQVYVILDEFGGYLSERIKQFIKENKIKFIFLKTHLSNLYQSYDLCLFTKMK